MLNLQAALPQDVAPFFLTLCFVLLFVLLAEFLVRRWSVSTLVVRKIVHLSMGVVIFFIPGYFQSNYYPALTALLLLLFNALNIRFKWLISLLAADADPAHSPNIKSYGSLFVPLVFLLQLLFLWESHKWILQTSMLVMGVGDSLAALVGSSVGKKHIEHLTKNPKTVEGSLTMFFTGFVLLCASLFVFSPFFTGALAKIPFVTLIALAMMLALVATAVEALLSHGLDNFFIPISIAYVLYVLDINQPVFLHRFLLGGVCAALLAVFSIKVKFLTNSGATATFLLGTTIFGIGGMEWTVPLLTFYLLSSILSKLGKKRKAKFDLVFEKGSQRDADQVYANGGIAWVLMILYSLNNDPAIYFAYLGTLAAVQADTWATEIGTLWPNPKAWLLTTLKRVPVGTSGGVSFPGTSAAFFGSLLICASALAMNVKWLSSFGWLESLLLIGFSGLLASLVDSFFGATIQAQYFDPVREKVTERTHSVAPDGSMVENRLIKGTPLVDNDVVNICCALSGSALAYLVIRNVHLFS
ncbi:MAG: DUF92 domain-containing protein [Chlorobium sp.]